MSRSRPEQHQSGGNPTKRYYQWNGKMEKGYFSHYEKSDDGGENIPFKGSFSFLVLDELVTVTGYSERSESGIFANEVHKLNEELEVSLWGSKQPFAKGKWADIKKDVAYEGGKFAFSIYGMGMIEGEWELINVKIAGSSLSPWIELKNKFNVFGNVAVIQRSATDETKGQNQFKSPVFELKEIEDRAILDAADKLDSELQKYLDDRGVEKSDSAGVEPNKQPDTSFPETAEDVNKELAYAGNPSEDDSDIPF